MAGLLPDPRSASQVTTAPRLPATPGTGLLPEPGGPTKAGLLPEPEPKESIPSNPLEWVGGLLGNAAGDLKEMAWGLGGLIQAGAHDALQGLLHVVPGEQGREYEDPSYLATIGKTMFGIGDQPSAILEDYKKRYGSVEGFFRGLYESPLAFISDALVVAGGAGAIAKAGRVGTLGKLPKLLPDSAAQRVLGPSLVKTSDDFYNLTGRTHFASESAGQSAVQPIKFSTNPLTRLAQRQVYNRLLTISPEKAVATADLTARQAWAYQAAEKAGMRVLRPTVSRMASNRLANSLISGMRLNTREVSQEALHALDEYIPESMDGEQVARHAMLDTVPDVLPDLHTPVQLTHTVPRLTAVPEELFTPGAGQRVVGNGHAYNIIPDKDSGEIAAPAFDDAPVAQNRLSIEVADLNGADVAAQTAFDRAGVEMIGVLDQAGDVDSAVDAVRYFGRTREGDVVELNVATPDMHRAQKAASLVREDLLKVQQEIADLEIEQADGLIRLEAEGIVDGIDIDMMDQAKLMGGNRKTQRTLRDLVNEVVIGAARLTELKQEKLAGELWMRSLFDHTRAVYNSVQAGLDVEPEFMAALRIRPWYQQNIASRWMRSSGKGYADMMNRAFGPQRINRFYDQMAEWDARFKEINASDASDSVKMKAARQVLMDTGVPEELAGMVTDSLRKYRPSKLLSKARKELWDYFVQEGGKTNDFPNYSWQVMAEQRIAAGLPLPTYYPHFSIGRTSEFMYKGKPSNLAVGKPSMAKTWEGTLYETGRVDMNARDAYARAARIWIQHEETIDYVNKVVGSLGRIVSRHEMLHNQKFGIPSGEVYVDLSWVKKQLNLRGQMMTDTIAGVQDHGDLIKATTDAADNLGAKLLEDAVNKLAKNEDVYAIPKHVADKLEHEIKLQLGAKMKMFWDTPLQVWKTTVLSLSPRWVINNFFGNTIFMGIENPGALRWAISQKSGKNERFMRFVLDSVDDNNIVRQTEAGFFRFEGEFATHVEPTGKVARAGQRVADFRPVKRVMRISDGVRHFNTEIEEAARRAVLLSALEKQNITRFGKMFFSSRRLLERIAKDGAGDPAQVAAAIDSVDKTLGNMTRYSVVEQNIIRRGLMPFYGFYRHMAKTVARMPVEHPAKFRVLQMIDQVHSDLESELPEYLQNQGAVDVSFLFGGADTVFRMKNLNPLSMVGDDIPVVSMLNPIVKVGLERALRVNTFTGESFEAPDNMFQDGVGQWWRKVEDDAGNVIDVERVKAPLPATYQHIGSQFGLLNMLPTFNQYPKSAVLSLLSYAGASPSQPAKGFQASLDFEDEMYQRAMSQATGVSQSDQSGFGTFAGFGSFGSF